MHCLRLSPDGRWLASGGADGSVLLYDIVASKVLAELKQGGHSAAVTDLVFHPNEFLLASGSLDGTVKFWDLESFAQVSSSSSSSASGGYLGPVRKVAFHPEGRALLAAGRDALKVYGWEPTVLYDSVDVHWGGGNGGGRLADMAVLEGQLVAGSCSRAATDASVYLVDIASLRPFCGGEEKGRKGDGLDDEGLLGDQATTFPRNTLRCVVLFGEPVSWCYNLTIVLFAGRAPDGASTLTRAARRASILSMRLKMDFFITQF